MRYTTEDLMTVAGLKQSDVKNYIHRNLFSHPIDPAVQGKPRLFDRESVIDFALLANLSGMGLDLYAAQRCVRKLLPKLAGENPPSLLVWTPDKKEPVTLGEGYTIDDLSEAFYQDSDEDDAGWTAEIDPKASVGEMPTLGVAFCVVNLKALVANIDRKLSGRGE